MIPGALVVLPRGGTPQKGTFHVSLEVVWLCRPVSTGSRGSARQRKAPQPSLPPWQMYNLAKTPDTAKAAVNTACGSGAGSAAGPLCRRSTTGPGRTAGGYGYCTLKTEIPKSITWEVHMEPLLTFLAFGQFWSDGGRCGWV